MSKITYFCHSREGALSSGKSVQKLRHSRLRGNDRGWFLFSFLLLFQTTAFAAESIITHLDIKQNKQQITWVITANSSLHPTIFSLKNPNRLVVDFKNTHLAKKISLVSLRIGYPKKNILRFVYDLPTAMQFKYFLSANKKQLNILLVPRAVVSTKKVARKIGKPAKLLSYAGLKQKINARMYPPHIVKPETILSQTMAKHTLIVMIDPGHGGKDPGAIGSSGLREKEVVFTIAKELAELINHTPNMHAYLTRNGDYFVTLHNRLVIARSKKADLFIAIHADSYFNTRAHGASVYALSQHGATTVAAKWLAKRENYYAELNNLDLGELDDQSDLLRSVLIDLAQTATIRDSLRFANDLLDSLEQVTRLHCSRVELAPFMVLKAPDVPSILVEIGFISNAKEEIHLRQSTFQHKIAYALFQGVQQYYNQSVH